MRLYWSSGKDLESSHDSNPTSALGIRLLRVILAGWAPIRTRMDSGHLLKRQGKLGAS